MSADAIRFRPVIEVPWYDHSMPQPWPWAIADRPMFSPLRINGDMSDPDVGTMVAKLSQPLDIEPGADVLLVLEALNRLDYLVLSGGLEVSRDSAVIISPGCCSGLENWRELHGMLDGESPWMGHGPTPRCEFLDDSHVRLWADNKVEGVVVPTVEVSRRQIADGLKSFHADLFGAMERLAEWLQGNGFEGVTSLVEKFGRSLAITVDTPLYQEFP